MKLNKTLKIAGIIIITLLIALGVLAYLLRTLITTETVKQFLLPVAEDYIGRKINVGEIKISIFSGIKVKDISIAERSGYGEGKFINCDEIDIRYNFLKLLQRELVLQSVYVKAPQINVVKDASGNFNFSDISEHIDKENGKKDSKEGGVEKIRAKAGDKGKEITFSIERVALKKGALKFTDKKINPDGRLWHELREINITLKGGFAGLPIDVMLKGGLISSAMSGEESSVSVKGNIDPSKGSMLIEAELNDIKPLSFKDYLFSDSSGPFVELKNIPVDIPFKITSEDYRKEIKIECTPKIENPAGDLVFSLSGTVKDIKDTPSYNAKVSFNKLPLTSMISLLSADLKKDLSSVEVGAGSVGGNLDISGTLSSEEKTIYKGDVTLTGFKGNIKDYNSLPVELDVTTAISPGRIDFKTEPLKVPGTSLSVKGVLNFAPEGTQNVSINAETQSLDIDSLINAVEGEKSEKNKDEKKKATSVREKKNPAKTQSRNTYNIKAKLAAGKVKYNNVMISDLKSEVQYSGDELLVEKVQCNFGEGSVSADGKANFSEDEPVFDGKADFQKAGLPEIIKILSPDFKGTVEGRLSGNTIISGKGSKWEKMKDELKGKGSITAENISLSNIKIMDQVASFLNVDELKKIQFRDGNMNFVIEDGKVKYDDFKLRGDTVKVKSEGRIGFDKSLNCDVELKLSPELSSKVLKNKELTAVLQDDKGWAMVPLTLKGTTDSPKPGLSGKVVNKKIIERGKELLNKELQKLFDKDSSKKKKGKDNLLDNLFQQLK